MDMTDLNKTYPSIGENGASSIQSLEVRMAQEGGYYDSVKPKWCESLRYQIIARPTTEQLLVLMREMPDMFDSVDSLSE